MTRLSTIRFLLSVLVLPVALSGCGTNEAARGEKLAKIAVWEDQSTLAGGRMGTMLADEDAAVRRRAALACARIGDTLAIEPLLLALNDTDADVRANAAFALAAMKAPRTLGDIVARLRIEREPSVLINLLQAMVPLYAKDSLRPALPFLGHRDPAVRAQAVITVGGLDPAGTVDQVMSLLDDPDPAVRYLTAFVLSNAGVESLTDRARALIADSVATLRALGYRMLGKIAPTDRRRELLAGLEDPDSRVRIEAAKAFKLLRDTMLILDAIPYLESEQDPYALAALTDAVGSHGRPQGRVALRRLLKSEYPEVRPVAADWLIKLDHADALDEVEPLLDDPVRNVRVAMAKNLMFFYAPQFGDIDRGVAFLEKLGRDPDPWVRVSAGQHLFNFGRTHAETIIHEMLYDPDPAVRYMGINGLARIGPRDWVDSIHRWFPDHIEDERPDTKWAMLATTANLSPSIQIDSIRRDIFTWGVTDPDRMVRWYGIAVWEKFREDHRDKLGTYRTVLTPDNVGETLGRFADRNPTVHVTTTAGEFAIELFADRMPRTVHHIVDVIESGHYTDMPINNVSPGVMVQTGDHRGDGWGMPATTVRDERTPERVVRGAVLALAGQKDMQRAGVGFVLSRQPFLDWRHPVMGRVTRGVEVLDRLRITDSIRTMTLIEPPT